MKPGGVFGGNEMMPAAAASSSEGVVSSWPGIAASSGSCSAAAFDVLLDGFGKSPL
jgi:hypothetical protein